MGRNPKNGDEVPIEPRRVILFNASHILKAKLNHTSPRRRRTPSRIAATRAEAQHERRLSLQTRGASQRVLSTAG